MKRIHVLKTWCAIEDVEKVPRLMNSTIVFKPEGLVIGDRKERLISFNEIVGLCIIYRAGLKFQKLYFSLSDKTLRSLLAELIGSIHKT